MKKTPFSDLKKLLSKTKTISIVTHVNPDGDAMGSSLGLYHYLKSKDKSVKVIVPNPFPDFLAWMPASKQAMVFEGNEVAVKKQIEKSDVIFILDFNNYKRVDALGELIRNSAAKKMVIDHHQKPDTVFDYYFHDVEASSTCELVYDFICGVDSKKVIDKKMANCLYTGIMTDTGSFRFASTTQKTFQVAAALIEAGAKNADIYNSVYDDYTENRLKLLGYCLYEKLVFVPEYKAAYIALSEDELKQFGFKKGDTEGIVNYALSVGGMDLSAFFSVKDGAIRISFRSKKFDVNNFARAHFNGGGHINAAGAKSILSLDDTVKKFIDLLPQYKTELKK
ncbi:MAG TPA: bifunctional oligoribonuclease/PAP phosphatase NrnA [Bacteroidia bacterium]|jgi:phosphoesterase RecJ-like protein|nr:bifunctional oligoribonuclease/PAP phosphatase NrnA [Bacteroidia bacterium]